MPAILGALSQFTPERMRELPAHGGQIFSVQPCMRIFCLESVLLRIIQRQAGGIIKEGAAGTRHRIDAAIGPRTHHIMLNHNGAPPLTLHERGVHITTNIFLCGMPPAVGLNSVAILGQIALG